MATVVGGLVFLIIAFLIWEAWPILSSLNWLKFFTDAAWQPSNELYLMLPMAIATIAVVLGAVLLATPIGVLSALFCHYYAPKPI
ncbi:MAG: phosphate ABC transporter permease subunit PstC, partial [Symploca sp. SIO3E6]|nr:phosphate ABC transporter permease subunit PstC [Caldora sp. SIO3E6]